MNSTKCPQIRIQKAIIPDGVATGNNCLRVWDSICLTKEQVVEVHQQLPKDHCPD